MSKSPTRANGRAVWMDKDKTTEIKTLLRDQKKEMAAIKGNYIFKELMRKPGEKATFRGQRDNSSAMRRGGREDTEAEGQMRMLKCIQDAGKRVQKKQEGVWSSFGKAYVCQGDFEEVRKTLPLGSSCRPAQISRESGGRDRGDEAGGERTRKGPH